jgi:VanZ family protein
VRNQIKSSFWWTAAVLYTIGIFGATPYLPRLINAASEQWSRSGVSRFILAVELLLAAVIVILALTSLIKKKKRPLLFLAFLGIIFIMCIVLYLIIPNPYEFTHLPEYALLSILLIQALKKPSQERSEKNIPLLKNPYVLSMLIVTSVGAADEVYQHFIPGRFFTVYDIFLNSLGGFLGTLIIGDI